jgi:hypothetical protein
MVSDPSAIPSAVEQYSGHQGIISRRGETHGRWCVKGTLLPPVPEPGRIRFCDHPPHSMDRILKLFKSRATRLLFRLRGEIHIARRVENDLLTDLNEGYLEREIEQLEATL